MTGVQTCALPISLARPRERAGAKESPRKGPWIRGRERGSGSGGCRSRCRIPGRPTDRLRSLVPSTTSHPRPGPPGLGFPIIFLSASLKPQLRRARGDHASVRRLAGHTSPQSLWRGCLVCRSCAPESQKMSLSSQHSAPHACWARQRKDDGKPEPPRTGERDQRQRRTMRGIFLWGFVRVRDRC